MFLPGEILPLNNQDYLVVDDFVSSSKNNIEDDHFISSSFIVNEKEYHFINTYTNLESENLKIGFWQTILNNHDFDYSQDFKYRFDIEQKTFLISYSTETGLSTHSNIELVNMDEFQSIDIDFSLFTNFEVVQTEAQRQRNRDKKVKKNVILHSVFWLLFCALIFGRYIYELDKFEKKKHELQQLQAKSLSLQNKVNTIIKNTIDNNVYTQQSHIQRLFYIVTNGVDLQSSSFDLSKSDFTATIAFKDFEKVAYIAKSQNFKIHIDPDFNKSKALLSWRVVQGKR